MYESFLDFFNKKSNLYIKLAESFVKLFNSIYNNINCSYVKKGNLISINSRNVRLLTIEPYKIITMGLQFIKITLYQSNLNEYNDIVNFIYNTFDKDIIINYIYFDISESDIPHYIGKLNKENYDDYIINLSANKYNL